MRISKCVANESRTFSFEAIHTNEPNAFALPGGYIFLTRSILELCQFDNDEIAFVMAHEMSHVIRGHAINRIMRDFVVSAASKVTPARGLITGWIKKVGIQYIESTYSQELELEADKLGVLLTHAAGYNPRAAITLLERLNQYKTKENKLDIGSYFSTHPPFSERIYNISEQLKLMC